MSRTDAWYKTEEIAPGAVTKEMVVGRMNNIYWNQAMIFAEKVKETHPCLVCGAHIEVTST